MSLRVLVAVAAAALVAPAQSQAIVKQAIQQAKAGGKQALAEHKARTDAAFDTLQDALDALVAGLEAGQFGVPLMQSFLDSAHAFQLEVEDATGDADLAIAEAFSGALAGLATEAGGLSQGFPRGFTSGDAGAFDATVDALARAVGKLYARVDKRCVQAIAKARKAGAGLSLQFVPAERRGFFGPVEAGEVGTFHNPVRVHLIAGASRLDVEEDGILLVAGTGIHVAGDVTVALSSLDGQGDPLQVSQDVTPTPIADLGGEWALLVDDGGQGLPERNWNLDAFQPGDLTASDGCAGVP